MKNLKLVILLCGGALLGLYISNGLDFSENTADTLVFLAAYALPTLMGGLALAKPPAEAWHGAIALAGFGVAAVRSRIWDSFSNLGADGKGTAIVILTVVGVIVSVLAMLKPESKT